MIREGNMKKAAFAAFSFITISVAQPYERAQHPHFCG